MPPTVTIAIPMFNAATTIEETVASIRAQTFTDWRCVIANDGSMDRSAEIVQRLSAEDDRIEMVSQHNQGLPEARNLGLERALSLGSEFVMLLDSDDLLAPRALEWLLPGARELGASYGGFEFIDSGGRPIGRESPMSAVEVGLREQLEWYRTMLQVSLFSREAIGEIRFDPEVRLAEDWFWCTRMAVRGLRWRGVEKIVAGYRLRPEGMSKNFAKMSVYHQLAIRKLFAMARSAGWDARIDVSDARHAQTAGASAMGYATMQALVEPGPHNAGAAIYEQSVHPERLTPLQIAQAGSNALPFGLCIGPDLDGVRERVWLPRLRRWWFVCAEEGWIDYGDIDPAMRELSRKIIHPDVIAGRMIERARSAGGTGLVGIIGLDRIGRRLARTAARMGTGVMAFDDWTQTAEVAQLESLPGVRVVRQAADLEPRELRGEGAIAAWVTGLTGEDAGRAIDRTLSALGGVSLTVDRWNEHREQLGEQNYAAMQEALETSRLKAG